MKTAEEIWDKLTYDQKLAATAYIFEKICDHARHHGTFRYLIYNRLGFKEDACVPLFSAGGMHISNEFNLREDNENN